MIRVLLFFIGVTVLAIGTVWLADRPGDISVTWLGYQVETSVMVGVIAAVLVVAAAILVWSIIRGIIRVPAAFFAARSGRRVNRAYSAVSRGIVAIGAGDAPAARRLAHEARRLTPNEPLALLLGAQTAQLAGDGIEAERTFRAMAERNDTKLLGLHGLFIEAQRRGDAGAARACAEEAAAVEPALPWAAEAALQYSCVDGNWVGALALLESNMNNGLVAKDVYRRQRAVLLTGRALSESEKNSGGAIDLALQALKLSPGLVPAAALAGQLLTKEGRLRKASRVIEAAWRVNPHPDLAEVYANIRPRLSSRERLSRMRTLARQAPNNPESAIAVARAAIDAQEFGTARERLRPLLENPTQRVAALMAEIEEKESGDVGRSREWMVRALTATRDPAWTADGVVSDIWMPISPTTGRLDAFEWRAPVADLGPPGPLIEYARVSSALQKQLETKLAAEPAATSAPSTPSAPSAAPQAAKAAEPAKAPQPAKAPEPAKAPQSAKAPEPAKAPQKVAAAPAQTLELAAAKPAAAPPPPPPPRQSATPKKGEAPKPAQPVAPLSRVPDDPGPEPGKGKQGNSGAAPKAAPKKAEAEKPRLFFR